MEFLKIEFFVIILKNNLNFHRQIVEKKNLNENRVEN